MKLIFEKSVPGRRCTILPACDVQSVSLPASLRRETKPALPEMSETDISRHYTELCKQVHGVNCGFYPLGSCTMKYNPRIDEEMAALPGFTGVHPLSPAEDRTGHAAGAGHRGAVPLRDHRHGRHDLPARRRRTR